MPLRLKQFVYSRMLRLVFFSARELNRDDMTISWLDALSKLVRPKADPACKVRLYCL